jgi:hypothetical protein
MKKGRSYRGSKTNYIDDAETIPINEKKLAVSSIALNQFFANFSFRNNIAVVEILCAKRILQDSFISKTWSIASSIFFVAAQA